MDKEPRRLTVEERFKRELLIKLPDGKVIPVWEIKEDENGFFEYDGTIYRNIGGRTFNRKIEIVEKIESKSRKM